MLFTYFGSHVWNMNLGGLQITQSNSLEQSCPSVSATNFCGEYVLCWKYLTMSGWKDYMTKFLPSCYKQNGLDFVFPLCCFCYSVSNLLLKVWNWNVSVPFTVFYWKRITIGILERRERLRGRSLQTTFYKLCRFSFWPCLISLSPNLSFHVYVIIALILPFL